MPRRTRRPSRSSPAGFGDLEILARGEYLAIITAAILFMFTWIHPRLVNLRLVAMQSKISSDVVLRLALRRRHE